MKFLILRTFQIEYMERSRKRMLYFYATMNNYKSTSIAITCFWVNKYQTDRFARKRRACKNSHRVFLSAIHRGADVIETSKEVALK